MVLVEDEKGFGGEKKQEEESLNLLKKWIYPFFLLNTFHYCELIIIIASYSVSFCSCNISSLLTFIHDCIIGHEVTHDF